MRVSVIIPTFNEEDSIIRLVNHLERHADERLQEIIVVDGGSKDQTVQLAQQTNATSYTCNTKGRAAQMNMGYRHSCGELLYFVHADSFPPKRTWMIFFMLLVRDTNPVVIDFGLIRTDSC